MNRLLSVIVLCCMAFQCLVSVGLVAQYQLNKKEITAAFCVNKAKPKMHCNGQCHLAKELKKADSDSDNKSSEKKSNKTELVFSSFISGKKVGITSDLVFQFAEEGSNPEDISNLYRFEFLDAIFHPPLV